MAVILKLRGGAGYFKILFFFLSIFMYYSFKRLYKVLEQIVFKLFGP